MRFVSRTLLLWLLAWYAVAPAAGSPTDRSAVLAVKTQDIVFYNTVLDAFRHGLEKRTGRSIDLTQVVLTGDAARDGQAIRDQMQKDPGLILTLGTNATRLVSELHPAEPVLFSMVLDPVSLGVAHSLDTPGGRFTGTTLLISPGKQFDSLLQVAPHVRHIGVLYTQDDATSEAFLNTARQEAQRLSLGIVAQSLSPGQSVDRAALEKIAGQVDAFWLIPDPASTGGAALSLTLDVSRAHKLPILGASGATVRAGALLALSADLQDMGDLDAEMALPLLQGDDPAHMRVRGPRRVTLSLNLLTAQALGLTLPDSVLHLADEVVDAPPGK